MLSRAFNSDAATQKMAKNVNKKLGRANKNAMASNDAIDALTDAQLDEFRDAFKAFDSDGGGAIDHAELKALMASVGQMPSDDEVAEMIKIADADGSGTVDFPEFVTLMAHKMINDDDNDRVATAFAVFDQDGSGHIEAEELRRIMINVGEPVTLEDCHTVLAEVDQDADGKISCAEFCRVLGEKSPDDKTPLGSSEVDHPSFDISSTEHLRHLNGPKKAEGDAETGKADEPTRDGDGHRGARGRSASRGDERKRSTKRSSRIRNR